MFYHSVMAMSNESELEKLEDKIAIMELPEVVFGNNHLLIANKESNLLLHFNAADSLSYAGFEKRRIFLQEKGVNLGADEPIENQADLS